MAKKVNISIIGVKVILMFMEVTKLLLKVRKIKNIILPSIVIKVFFHIDPKCWRN